MNRSLNLPALLEDPFFPVNKLGAIQLFDITSTADIFPLTEYKHSHWRRSALNSAGALQSGGGEFRGIFTPFYTINFRGLCKTGGARAPAAPPSSAPMMI